MNDDDDCGVQVATPGRLHDLLNRGHVNLRHVELWVMDEADELLSAVRIEPHSIVTCPWILSFVSLHQSTLSAPRFCSQDFLPQLRFLTTHEAGLPFDRVTAMFGATFPPRAREKAKLFLSQVNGNLPHFAF
jgi:superfamily II DNA/RNA helicase